MCGSIINVNERHGAGLFLFANIYWRKEIRFQAGKLNTGALCTKVNQKREERKV